MVLFLRLKKVFCYIPENESEQSVLGWNKSTCAVAFRTTHGQNNMHKCDTEGFLPVSSLNVMVRSLSLFIVSLIGSTGKIWYVLYSNKKWIYASKTLACTISECAIVCNVLHVTLTCPLISWCSVAANFKLTLWIF